MSTDSPVYLLAELDVTSLADFITDYAGPVAAINERHGAEVLAATPSPTVIEGDYRPNLTVLLKFPSVDHQQAWYTDPDYRPLLQRRLELTDATHSALVALPAFEVPTGEDPTS